jgi:hypothetical protein
MSRCWPSILSHLPEITATHHLGKPVPDSFSTKIQRKLASTVPPRPIVDLAFSSATEKLQQLCTDCSEATRFISLPIDPLEYQSFLCTFASRSPPPLCYSRAYLATILFHPDILDSGISLPLTDVKSLVFPASPILNPKNWTLSPPRNPLLPKPPRLQLALLIDEFVDRAGQPYLDFWVALGQNRCRLRRLLTHVIVAWDMLQIDAALVDADLMTTCQSMGIANEVLQNPLAAWVYTKKLWMMEKVILLGFEQDVYLPDEFAAMYYFLSVVAGKRRDVLQRCADFCPLRRAQLLKALPPQVHDLQEVEDMRPYIEAELQHAKGVSELASALFIFYNILLYLRLRPCPNRPTSAEALRYELRMKPFLALQPMEVPPFEDFQAAVQPYGPYNSPLPSLYTDLRNADSPLWTSVETALKNAKDAFAKVKKLGAGASKASGVEQAWAKDINSLLASCVALGVALVGVKREAQTAEAGYSVNFSMMIPKAGEGKRYAEGWVVGAVVEELGHCPFGEGGLPWALV